MPVPSFEYAHRSKSLESGSNHTPPIIASPPRPTHLHVDSTSSPISIFNTEDGTSNDGTISTSSTRLSRMRNRVEDKKEKFRLLLHNTSPTSSTVRRTLTTEEQEPLKTQLKNLALALEEKFVEVQYLSKKKESYKRRLQHKGGATRSLYPELDAELTRTRAKLEAVQELYQERTEDLRTTKFDLHRTKNELEKLRRLREEQQRQIIGFQIDLETHEVNFSRHIQEETEKLHDDAQNELAQIGNDTTPKSSSVKQLEETHGCRIQQLVAKLLADQMNLEERYKRDKSELTKELDQVREANQLLSSKVNFYEHRLLDGGNSSTKYLLQRCMQLENGNRELRGLTDTFRRRTEEVERRQLPLIDTQDQHQAFVAEDVTTMSHQDLQDYSRRLQDQMQSMQHHNAIQQQRFQAMRLQAINFHCFNSNTSEHFDKKRSVIAECKTDSDSQDHKHSPSTTATLTIQNADLQVLLLNKEKQLRDERERNRLRELFSGLKTQQTKSQSSTSHGEFGTTTFF